MAQAHRIALASFIVLIGCGSDRATTSDAQPVDRTASSTSFDPLNGDYPQIMWMCNVYEVPAGTEIDSDGLVSASSKAKPNGVGVVLASNVTRAVDSIRSLPNARHLGTPVSFSPPASTTRIEPETRDKAGSSIGDRSIELNGLLKGDFVGTSAEIATASGAFQTSCRCGARDVPKGGALLFLCPGASSSDPWTLLMVRPTVLRSTQDFPFQRASSFSTAK
ncbi:MAG: hypothetical protein JNL80_17450 [Phycisphaerae bacterium]|jgi:hypothetical protein|nr:hypothetical protein [Phycisphaerae bacterium]